MTAAASALTCEALHTFQGGAGARYDLEAQYCLGQEHLRTPVVLATLLVLVEMELCGWELLCPELVGFPKLWSAGPDWRNVTCVVPKLHSQIHFYIPDGL